MHMDVRFIALTLRYWTDNVKLGSERLTVIRLITDQFAQFSLTLNTYFFPL